MPICTPCRRAAEGTSAVVRHCSECDREGVSVYATEVPLAEQKVVFHKRITDALEYGRCPGSGRPPVIRDGHDRCDGCPCQHKPRGSWNASNE